MTKLPFPSPAARYRALGRLFTAILWRNGEPSCVSAEDIVLFEIIKKLADRDYDTESLMEEAEAIAKAHSGMEND